MAASSQAEGTSAGAHTALGQDSHTDHTHERDFTSGRVADFDKDTGTDERLEVEGADRSTIGWLNGKRTYDLHQTLDTEAVLNARREQTVERERARLWDDREQQMRLRHADAEFNQRMRHADFQVTALAAITGEMVEAIANKTAERVCARIKAG